ncbi:hypothetical protein [Parasitella parasitica]|uniref:Uncharacterized protein n=1 Tax=Parasitella parasitica TaxID=35722 RepID=A0A0B7MP40_9FUNG|nr:hypothetical protein [Parasitella parasitica]
MVYVNWEASSSAANLSTFKWYSVESIIDYIQSLRQNVIYRLRQETSMPVLSCIEAPVSKTKRFQQGYFICDGVGNWEYNLNRLSLYLVRLNRSPSCQLSASFETAIERDVLRTVHSMLGAIEKKVDMMDQFAFETRYGLVWEATAAKEDDHDVMKCPNIFCYCYKNAVVYISLLLGKKNKAM